LFIGGIEVEIAGMEVDVCDEALFIAISVSFLDQPLNLVVDPFDGAVGQSMLEIGQDVSQPVFRTFWPPS